MIRKEKERIKLERRDTKIMNFRKKEKEEEERE
jgi:hypothetical protein